MNSKLIGAIMVISGCGFVGFRMASHYLRQLSSLRKLIAILDYMECELQYRYTPLPELCREAAGLHSGILQKVFLRLSQELEDQISPDVDHCMQAALGAFPDLPDQTRWLLDTLGRSMGRFDLEGQLKGLEGVRQESRRQLEQMLKEKDTRTRSYQTLGLCAGAALAILFL